MKQLNVFDNPIPYIMEGQVVATDDPDQMGRVKVWVPSLDGENFSIDSLPWADYASPFCGFTVDYPAGGHPVKNASHAAYGFWAIPKIGATVLVFCLNANQMTRYYFASTLRLHRNRSLPAGRNTDFNGNLGPFGDAGDGKGNLNPIQPAYDNLREQFQNNVDSPQAISRGFYERQVAQGKYEKDGAEGYAKNPADNSYLDPQTYCLVTPGRHALIMQDDPKFSRLRLKTAEGHQIIFDDANERIYVSTSKGKSWIEMDADGHVHVFAAESLSMRAGKDINFFADGDFNVEAEGSINMKANEGDFKLNTGGSVHIKSAGDVLQSACGNFDIDSEKSIHLTSSIDLDMYSGGSIAQTAAGAFDILSGGAMKQSARKIDLNGPKARQAVKAECPSEAGDPSVVPGHEPWKRPDSRQKRGPNWKE